MKTWYEELKPLVDAGLSTQQIADKFKLSKTTIRYRLNKCQLQTKYTSKEDKNLYCLNCLSALKGNQTHFCSKKCKTTFYKENNYSKSYKSQYIKGRFRRKILIKNAGNKCVTCGYDRNDSVLSFHHIDPATKNFKIDVRSCSNTSMKKLLVEADKCILLCANCHTELHNPNYNNY